MHAWRTLQHLEQVISGRSAQKQKWLKYSNFIAHKVPPNRHTIPRIAHWEESLAQAPGIINIPTRRISKPNSRDANDTIRSKAVSNDSLIIVIHPNITI